MTDIISALSSSTSGTSTSQAAAEAFSQAAASDGSSGSTKLSTDFQTFLEMLTAQMQNQDPLNPIDSSEYASQLAAFSSVEQQVLTNDLLTALFQQNSDSSMTQLASWVGMDARTSAGANFSGAPISLSPLPAKLADEAWLVVRDDAGAEVQRQKIGLDGETVDWAGVDTGGLPFADGFYTFEVENHAGGSLLGTTPVETYANVVEAQIYNGTTILILEGGVQVLASDVTALRNPTQT